LLEKISEVNSPPLVRHCILAIAQLLRALFVSAGAVVYEGGRRIVRAVPDRLGGKTRLARLALRPFLNSGIARIPDRFGNVLHVPSLQGPISVGLFGYGVHEPDTLAAILRQLRPSGVFVDVGANIGVLALPVAACRPDARVICIEADPGIVSFLQRNVAENQRWNVRVVRCLAGPIDDRQVSFYRAPAANFGMGSIGPQFDTPPVTLVQRPLDDVLDELSVDDIDVVKLDIEGAEFGALQGLRRRLTGPRSPAIVFEFIDWAETRIAGQAAGNAQRFLLSFGYSLFRLARGGRPGERIECPVTTGYAMILALPPSRNVSTTN
jgi:FkbM family methyltransferase